MQPDDPKDDVQTPTGPPPSVVELLNVVRISAAAIGLKPSHDSVLQAASTVVQGLPGPDDACFVARLTRTASDVGLSVSELRAPLRDAMASVSPRCPLLVRPAGGPAVTLTDYLGGRVKLRRTEHGDAEWVGEADLMRLLGAADANATIAWVVVEAQLPFAPTPHEDGHHGPEPIQRLYDLLRTEREDLFVLVAYAAFVGILSLATPIATQSLVNSVAFGTLLQPIAVLALLLFGTLGFTAVVNTLSYNVVEHLQRRMFVRVVADLVHRLPRVRVDAFDTNSAPELVNRFFDVLTLQKSLATLLLDGITLALTAAVGLTLLAVYHPLLLGFDVLLVILVSAVLFGLGRGAQVTAIEESKAKYAVASWIDQLARHPFAFKSAPELASQRADALAHKYLQARGDHFQRVFRQIGALNGLYALVTALLFGIGGWLVIERQLTLGQLIAAELVVGTILGTFAKFGKQLDAFYDLLAALDKLGHLVELPLERVGGETPPPSATPASIKVHGASYGFAGEPVVLADCALDVGAGQRVAIDGPSGSGKSVLLQLLAGVRTPTQGHVHLDGVDLRDLRLEAVRRDVALVSGIEPIDGTVHENVAMGRPGVTPSDVRRALADVGLLDEIADLPRGQQTHLAPGGAPLSYGQTARLMLARALAGRPRVLLIDEVLDGLGTDALHHTIPCLFSDERRVTVVLVSQNPELHARCDRVVTLKRAS